MKILQLIQKPQLRGAETFASQLGNQLLAAGHGCKIISLFPGDAQLPFKGEVLQLNRPLKKRFWDWKGWKKLAIIIRFEQPTVIQANAGDTLKFAVLSKILFGWKTPIVFRNANKIGDFIDSRTKYWLNKFFTTYLTHVISVSDLCRKDFIQTFEYDVKKIDTVQIGIDVKQVESLPQDIKHVFDQGPVVVNVASLVAEKNHTGLLIAFKKVLAEKPNGQLLIIGKGGLQAELQTFAEDLDIISQVHFLGYRNDVLEIIKGASALLLPSFIEGLPGVILEAQYCKTPVVANNVGGISEIIQPGETGWLVEKGNEDAFAAAVLEVLNAKPDDLKQITDAAYRQVVEHYDNKVIAERFVEVYKKVVNGTAEALKK